MPYKKGTPEYEAWILTHEYIGYRTRCSKINLGKKKPYLVKRNKSKKMRNLNSERMSGSGNHMFGISGEKHPRWKPRVKLVCESCGIEFEVLPYKSTNGKYRPKCCSLKCRGNLKSGENHPLFGRIGKNSVGWRGGVSFERYCQKFNKRFRQRVRLFFNNVCVECGKTKEENGQNLSVHHVNFDKQTCCREGEKITDQKFVTLCKHCHSYATVHPEWAIEHYTHIVDEKYNGKSYISDEEYVECIMKKRIESCLKSPQICEVV